jgi:NAD-dependent SIR2 family protein deacetylase
MSLSDDDRSPVMSNLAFGSYVVRVLIDYLNAQGKSIHVATGADYYDAILPDGIDELPGPVYLDVKYSSSNKNGYFRSVGNYSSQIKDADKGILLLILGDAFSDRSLDGLLKLAQSKAKRRVAIWDIQEFTNRTKDYQQKHKNYVDSPAKAVVEEAINSPASDETLEKSRDSLLGLLKQKYKNQDLALFLGAGVSVDAGIPKWSDLINSLLSEMILHIADRDHDALLSSHLNEIIKLAYENKEESPITQMRYIRSAFSSTEYQKIVHDTLYKNRPKPFTDLLDAIAALCTPKRNHIGVQGVVTYNFDDLLERRLRKLNVLINTISSEEDLTDPDQLSIFHVHGYLPQGNDEYDKDLELIFSEEDYHRVYRDAYCWSNIVQLNYLREHTCLFIGCSLSDPNLRRLLDVATRNNEKPRHFAFLRKNNSLKTSEIDPDALNAYNRIDVNLREKCYAEMGINIIWIDEFKDIPKILERLLY